MSTPKVQELDKHLKDLVKWERFAYNLPEIDQTDIEIIKEDVHDDVVEQKLALFRKWLQKYPLASWNDVIMALEKTNENTLASRLKKTFFKDQVAQQPEAEVEAEVKVSKEIVGDLDDLHEYFANLTMDVKSKVENVVENGEIPIKRFVRRIEEEKAFDIPELKSVQTTDKYFGAIMPHYNFLNCHLLICVALMLSAHKSIVNAAKEYSKRIEMFNTKTEVKQLRCALHPYFPCFTSSTSAKVIIILQDTWGKQKLWVVREFVKMLFGLEHPDQCQWFKVIPGSLTVIFSAHKRRIMAVIVNSVKKLKLMSLLGVISLQVGDIHIPIAEEMKYFTFDIALILATEACNTEAIEFLLRYTTVGINNVHNIPSPRDYMSQFFSRIAPYETSTDYVENELKSLHRIFLTLSTEAELRSAVDTGVLSVEYLIRHTKHNITCIHTKCLDSITTVNEFLNEIKPRYTFLNCRLIVTLALLISGSNALNAKYYLERLEEFKKFAVVAFLQHELPTYFRNIHPNINETVTITLHNVWQQFRMDLLEQLIQSIFSLKHPDELQWLRVTHGSLIVVFKVPKDLMMHLIVSGVKKIRLMKLTGVVSLRVDNVYILRTEKQGEYCVEEATLQAETCGDKEALQFLTEQIRFAKKQLPKDQNNNWIFSNHHTISPLILACQNGDLRSVKLFLAHNADPNARNGMQWTPMMYASIIGSINVMNVLLLHNTDINAKINDGSTVLMQACSMGNLRVVKFLLSKQAKTSIKGRDGLTALHLASARDHPEVVETLLDAQIDPNDQTDDRSTALHLASLEGHLDVVEVLLKKQANINAKNVDGATPLIRAIQEGYLKTVNLLLKFHADPTIQMIEGTTALHDASHRGHLKIVKRLLQEKPDINIQTEQGVTPLHSASYQGHLRVAEALIEEGAYLNIQKHNGETPMYTACWRGNSHVVNALLKAHADPNIKRDDGMAPIHIASMEGYQKIVSILLAAHVDPNIMVNRGFTPLYSASEKGHLQVVNMLLEAQADPNLSAGGITPLYRASYRGNLKIVKRLIEAEADVNLQCNDGSTPLIVASQFGRFKVVCLLLEAKANVNIKANDGATPIHIASSEGHLRVVKKLLKAKANPNVQGDSGSTPLYVAIHIGHSKLVNTLLRAGADPTIPLNDGSMPIIKACMKGHSDILQALLEAKVDPNVQSNGSTPLNAAIQNGNLQMLESLLKAGADPNLPSTVQMTKNEFEAIIDSATLYLNHKALLYQKAWCEEMHTIRIEETNLELAAYKGHLEVVKMLLGAKANPDVRNIFGETLLYKASRNSNLELASMLLEAQADPNIPDMNEMTPLHLAIQNHHSQIIELLLAAKADLTRCSNVGCGPTPLITACTVGYTEAVERLLQGNADPNGQATTGETPLLFASKYSHVHIMHLLLNAGTDPNLQNIYRVTPLHVASENGTEEVHLRVVNILLEAGADPSAQNHKKVTPIHIASQNGHLEVLETLVKAKGKPTPEELDAIEKLRYIRKRQN